MIGIIGGTGLGETLFGVSGAKVYEIDTPYGRPSNAIQVVKWHGAEVALLARHGDGHVCSPAQVPYRANIYALKSLGVTHVLASGAVGSLREHLNPRELVIPDQVIDKTSRRTPTFFDEGLAVHVEFAEPFCPDLRALLLSVASQVETTVHGRGTYVCMEGPAFSSVAESQMHRAWGGDIVGMTAMPEAKLAREAELSYALVALVTDYDCWRPHAPDKSRNAVLQEIIGHLKAATLNAMTLMRAAIEAYAIKPLEPGSIHTGLDLAVWTDREKITPEIAKRYGVLLKRYLAAN
ncbi:MAG: S-methyl-5'-thioadenosine phosphorylase [Phycisphaerae bacterium]|nr:S-methyl-5'-thioadenosine phosphorylase [Phycisphaerae bacterium]